MSKSTRMSLTHQDIATLAYTLWLKDGCPEGAHEQHWHMAEAELAKPAKKVKAKKQKTAKKQAGKKQAAKKQATRKNVVS